VREEGQIKFDLCEFILCDWGGGNCRINRGIYLYLFSNQETVHKLQAYSALLLSNMKF
jgi:hypothetical protein